MDSQDQLLLVDEVAEMLRVPKAQVYRLAKTNRIAVIKISARCTRFSKSSVLQFLSEATK